MTLETIESILMSRDGNSESQATERLEEASKMIAEGEDPEEVLREEFGLESDYIFDADLGIFN
jgi:hypothetical protein